MVQLDRENADRLIQMRMEATAAKAREAALGATESQSSSKVGTRRPPCPTPNQSEVSGFKKMTNHMHDISSCRRAAKRKG